MSEPTPSQLVIPWAAPPPDDQAAAAALRGLRLPALQRLLAALPCTATDMGTVRDLSLPHERVLARICGLWPAGADAARADGRIPWAAWERQQAQGDAAGAPWAWLTPCHWQVGSDHIRLTDPAQLRLDAAQSQAFLEAMRPYAEQDGLRLEWQAPLRWLARGEIFRSLACAALDRVAGRSVDAWLPRAPEARPLRRLQQEMQMLLYTHPLNDERAQAGLPPVNSFWVTGAGALPPGATPPPAGLVALDDLRQPWLQADWPAWADAWRRIDAETLAPLAAALDAGQPVELTLCGERGARTWAGRRGGALERLKQGFLNKIGRSPGWNNVVEL